MDYADLIRQSDDAIQSGRTELSRQILYEGLSWAQDHNDTAYEYLCQAELSYLSEDYEKSENLCRKADEHRPGDPLILRCLGVYLSCQSREEESIEVFDQALAIAPDDPELLREKGISLGKLDREEEAIDLLDRVLAIKPNDYDALRNKGALLSNRGYDEDIVIDLYDRALAINPNDYNALRDKGTVLSNLGHREQAIALFDQVLAIKPNDYNTLRSKGVALLKLDRLDEAEHLISQALEIAPNDQWNIYWSGYLLERIGKVVEAVKLYKRVKELPPSNVHQSLRQHVDFKLSYLHDIDKEATEEDTSIATTPSNGASVRSKVLNQVISELDPDGSRRLLRDIANTRSKLAQFTSPTESVPADCYSFFSVLRKWNSYTPVLPSAAGDSLGGGYFLFHKGKGIVIDPGFNFVENFYSEGFKVADIDAILITHAHNDHTVDLESILSLLYKMNSSHNQRKRIDLLLNVGSFMKYSGWLSLNTEDPNNFVASVTILHPGNTYEYGELKIHATYAKHHEIISSDYCIGCIIEAEGPDGFRLGLTSDTGWKDNESIEKQFLECKNELMVVHIGSIKEKEFGYREAASEEERRDCYDKYHLGILGVTNVLHAVRPKLAVVSEFGEELKSVRAKIARALKKALDINCLPGDIGLHIRLSDLAVLCCDDRDFVEPGKIVVREVNSEIAYCADEASAIDTRALSEWRKISMPKKLEK